MDVDMKEFLDIFLSEGAENIKTMAQAAETLKTQPADTTSKENARTTAHTLKGLAAQMGYEDIATLSRAVEELYIALRDKNKPATAEMAQATVEAAALLTALLNEVGTPENKADKSGLAPLADKIKAFTAGA